MPSDKIWTVILFLSVICFRVIKIEHHAWNHIWFTILAGKIFNEFWSVPHKSYTVQLQKNCMVFYAVFLCTMKSWVNILFLVFHEKITKYCIDLEMTCVNNECHFLNSRMFNVHSLWSTKVLYMTSWKKKLCSANVGELHAVLSHGNASLIWCEVALLYKSNSEHGAASHSESMFCTFSCC